MGEVYRARDTRLKRDVALKLLPESFASDPDRLARFQREAEVLASLSHPNIAAIHGLEESDGNRALVMELVEGEDLSQRIARGPIPVDEALPIARQIAEALEAAHEQGIIHRDLKPANIKLRPDGTVKVLDFGLAKLAEPAGSAQSAVGNASLSPTITSPALMTGVGVLLGTAAYMSPEQAKGREADKRSDIWAFGCVLYEMLTGKRAFEGEDVSDTLANVLKTQPDWTVLPRHIPATISHIVRRCLDKHPVSRISQIAVVLFALSEFSTNSAGTVDTLPLARSRAWEWLSAGALVVVVAAGLSAIVLRSLAVPSPPVVRFDVPLASPNENQLALSPDGRYLAAIAPTGLWVRALDQVDARVLNGTTGAQFPFWSADSRWVAFFAGGKLKKADLSGTPPLTIADAPAGRGGSWNSDGVIVFAPGTDGPLYRVSASGGTPLAVTALDQSRGESLHAQPWFLPDGTRFIFVARGTKSAGDGLYVGSIDSKETRRLTNAVLKAAFAPPRFLLFTRGDTLVTQDLDIARLELSGEPTPVAAQIGTNTTFLISAFAVSSNGVLAYRGAAQDSALEWYDRTGRQIAAAGIPASYNNPALSPDGLRVAIEKSDGPTADIWIIDTARNTTSRFTFDPAFDGLPLWSPDGDGIVFSSTRETGIANLYQKQSGGAGQEQLLLKTAYDKWATAWSSDGRYLIYQERNPKTEFDIWALPLYGDRKPTPLLATPFNEVQAQLSPDGRWLAYTSDESGISEVYVQPFPSSGGKWQISSGGGRQPRWRHDGRELFFITAGRGELMGTDIQVLPGSAGGRRLNPGVPRKLFDGSARRPDAASPSFIAGRNDYDSTADGQRFLFRTVPTRQAISVVLNWTAGLKK
jgi:Tol biopolymer transport system component